MKVPKQFICKKWCLIKIFLGLLLLTYFVTFWFSRKLVKSSPKINNLEFYTQYAIFIDSLNGTECRIPEYYDSSWKRVSSQVNSECFNVETPLTFIDQNGTLQLNVKQYENGQNGLKCSYRMITEDKYFSGDIIYTEETKVNFPKKKIDFFPIKVTCKVEGVTVYETVHDRLELLPYKSSENIDKIRPSIFILIVNSVSRRDFIQAIPLTYLYLSGDRGMTTFRGLNKIAANSSSNLKAFFTGCKNFHPWKEVHPDFFPCLNIWEKFKDENYTTMYREEFTNERFDTFDDIFDWDTIDYNSRMFRKSSEETILGKESFINGSKRNKYCLWNSPSYEYVLNYTEEFLTKIGKRRYLAVSYLTETSKRSAKDTAVLDIKLSNFFERNFEKYLKNNIVVLMGDSDKESNLREGLSEYEENKIAFFGIILPKGLKKEYPHLQKSLDSHTGSLLSWYDLHKTMLEIARGDFGTDAKSDLGKDTGFGTSILRKFHERTCRKIGIEAKHCICDREAELSLQSDKTIEAVNIILEQINTKILPETNQFLEGDKMFCSYLKIFKLLYSNIYMQAYASRGVSVLVKVGFMVTPESGKFEGVVEYEANGPPKVLGPILRIDEYAEKSSCMTDLSTKMYCICVPKNFENNN